jgi:hypothetical protein
MTPPASSTTVGRSVAGATAQVVTRYDMTEKVVLGRSTTTLLVTREFDAGNVCATTDKLGRRMTYRHTATDCPPDNRTAEQNLHI